MVVHCTLDVERVIMVPQKFLQVILFNSLSADNLGKQFGPRSGATNHPT